MSNEFHLDILGNIVQKPFNPKMYGENIIWIDSLNPDDAELARLDDIAGFEVPNHRDMLEIELSNRLYKEYDAFVMIANLLPKSEAEVLPLRPVAFILRQNLLITIRYNEFSCFDRVASMARFQAEIKNPQTMFTALLDEAVSDRADELELSMRRLEELTSKLFLTPHASGSAVPMNTSLDLAMKYIGGMGERVANIRESIASMQRVVNYAKTYIHEDWMQSQIVILESIRTDLTALSDEASFFMNKLSFNLDATLGMINIEETKVIRVLSIITLLLSPPTLIAGIYGMNFRLMPELDWQLGYVFSLSLMATTAIMSLWYLKRKKWL